MLVLEIVIASVLGTVVLGAFIGGIFLIGA